MSGLEQTYRRALRWYPKRWRTANEDAALGTLLDQAEAESRTRPSRGELANLVGGALNARLSVVDKVVAAPVRERAALITLALGFTIASSGVYGSILEFQAVIDGTDQRFPHDPLVNWQLGYYLIWVIAFAAAIIGLRRISIVLVTISIPASVTVPLVSRVISFGGGTGTLTVVFLDLLALVYLFGSPRVVGRFRRRLAIVTVGFVATFAVMYLVQSNGYVFTHGVPGLDWFWDQYAILISVVGLPAVVVAAIVLWRTRRSVWAPAMLLAAVPLLPLTIVEFSSSWYASAWIALIVAVVVAAALILLRVFGLRVTITRT